jgi:hypothetical protein
MKNIRPQPTARQNNCRNGTSAAIAHRAEWIMTASHGNLNLIVTWLGFYRKSPPQTNTPTVIAVGVSSSPPVDNYFNKPPLRSGDDAASTTGAIQKSTFLNAR